MKTVIQITKGYSFYNIADAYPNRVKQYWLNGDTLTVISTNVSDVSSALFQLKLKGPEGITEYTFSRVFDRRDWEGKHYLTHNIY